MKREAIVVDEVYVCGPPHTNGQSLVATIVSTEPHFALLDTKNRTMSAPLDAEPTEVPEGHVVVEGVLAHIDKAAWPLYEPFVGEDAVIRYRFVKSVQV